MAAALTHGGAAHARLVAAARAAGGAGGVVFGGVRQNSELFHYVQPIHPQTGTFVLV